MTTEEYNELKQEIGKLKEQLDEQADQQAREIGFLKDEQTRFFDTVSNVVGIMAEPLNRLHQLTNEMQAAIEQTFVLSTEEIHELSTHHFRASVDTAMNYVKAREYIFKRMA
jgi:hypothetical protein